MFFEKRTSKQSELCIIKNRAPEKSQGFLGKRSGSLTSAAVFSAKKTRQAIKACRDVVRVFLQDLAKNAVKSRVFDSQ